MSAVWLHLVQSTVVAACLVALHVCLPRRLASLRYLLLLGAMLKFAVPVSWLVEAGRIVSHHSRIPAAPASPLPPEFLAVFASSPAHVISAHPFVPLLLATLWLIGSATLLCLWIWRWRTTGRDCEKGVDESLAHHLNNRIHLPRLVRVRISQTSEVCLRGIWRPVLHVPKRLDATFTAREREAILLHELAHVYRMDNFWSMMIHLLVCCFWFHPALWWLERRLSAERERACDQWVVANGSEPESYVAGILKACRHALVPDLAGTAGIARSDLERRLQFIRASSRSPLGRGASRALILAIGLALVGLPLLIGSAMPEPKAAAGCWAVDLYPEGTALQMGATKNAPVKECSQGKWVPTRKQATAVAKELPAFICEPETSTSATLCACHSHGGFSLGAIVQGSQERMRCDSFTLGHFSTWRPLTAQERRR